jgi:hypothetical protein
MPKEKPPKGGSAVRLVTWASARVRAEVARRRAKKQLTGPRIGILCCAAALGLSALITYAPMTLLQLLAPCIAVLVVAVVAPPLDVTAPAARTRAPIR